MKQAIRRAAIGLVLVVSACGRPTDDVTDFVPVPAEAERAMHRSVARLAIGTTGTPVLFVNFDGAQVVKGYAFNQSFIPCVSVATIPAYPISQADRDAVLAKVQAHFANVQANIRVTKARPASGTYTTIQVGGTYSGSLGCSGTPYGIAPMPSKGSVGWMGFVFARSGDSLTMVAQAIAHEAGHTFSLNHLTASNDVMYPVVSWNPTAFMAGTIYGSSQYQDSPQILRNVLGTASGTTPFPTPTPTPTPAPTPAPVACVGSTLPANGSLRANQALCSSDGRFRATLQSDGNLVVANTQTGQATWSTRTTGGTLLWMQSDCNLVLYSPTRALWWNGTNGRGASCRAVMQSDGNLVVYRNWDGRALWSIWTGILY